MLYQQKVFAIVAGAAIFCYILYLVHSRRLREEYSWFWLVTGMTVVVLVVWYDLLLVLTSLIGAVVPTTTLFLFGMIFLLMVSLHYSVKISELTNQVRALTQQVALLAEENREIANRVDRRGSGKDPGTETRTDDQA
ncbi:MAG: DUF2304 domain-containing protein [Desulfatibacillaceae bacterium]